MKLYNILNVALIAVILFSCDQNEKEKLEEKKAELESTISTAKKDLAEVEEKLAKLDTAFVDYPDVTVVKAEKNLFEHYITLQGTVEAGHSAMVVPEMGGIITSLPVEGKEGMLIKKGEVIAKFDTKTISANEDELDKQIELAKYMYEKQQSLYDKGVGTELQKEQAKLQYEALLKTKSSIKTQKGKFILTAPFTGMIEKVYMVQGQLAAPGTPIIMLVGIEERKIISQASETYLGSLKKGAAVQADFPALEQELAGLKVDRISGIIDPVNRTIDVEIKIPNFTEKHVPNLVANVRIRDYVDSNAVTVPTKVILKDKDQKNYVFVLDPSKENSTDSTAVYLVKKEIVSIGNAYDGRTVITEGLQPGSIVVNRGRQDISENSFVEIVEL